MVNATAYKLGSQKSGIRELFEYGMRLAEQVGRENVYDYSIGNPSVPAPEAVNEAIRELTRGDSLAVHGYTPASGCKEAVQAIAEDLNNRYGNVAAPKDIFITCGAAPALVSVLRALSVENSEIVVLAPFFPEYTVFIETAGEKPVIVPTDPKTFQIDVKAVEKVLNRNTQAIIVNSPNNPSGTIYGKDVLAELSKVLRAKSAEFGHPIYIISDEPYRELVYDGAEVPYVPSIYENTIICYSYSKSLSLPGDRLGYVFVPACCEDHDAVYAAVAGAARACGHVCAPAIMQKAVAACVALRPDIETYDKNRQLLYDSLTSYGYECVKPQGAFYLFVKAPGGDSVRFCEKAKEYRLLLVPGNGFGCPDHFRLCTCVSNDMIKRSLPSFKELIENYK